MTPAPAIVAGFGLFFVGIRLIGDHLQQMATRRVRQFLGRAMTRPGVAPLAGLALGGLVQSSSGVTFIAVSLLTSGLLTMGPAMSALAWSNVSTSILVLLSAIDLETMALYLLGLIGLAYFQGRDKEPRSKHLVNALLGAGLLFLGLSLVKSGTSVLAENPWTEEFVIFSGESATVAFLVGIVAAVAAQSSATVTILALPLVDSGILGESQMTLIVYGASVGSGLAVMLLSSNLGGSARQLALYQSLVKLLGAAVFVPLYYAERVWGIPLVQAAVAALADTAATRIALVYLAFQIGAAVLGGLFRAPLRRLLAELSPPTVEESVMRPRYLYDEAITDPATALTLVDREEARLVEALASYLDPIRPPEERAPDALPLATRHAASSAVAAETDHFLAAVLAANPAYGGVERVFEIRTRLHVLQSLQTCLHDFARHLEGSPSAATSALRDNLVESLHFLLTLLGDARRSGDREDAETLGQLTAGRSDLMDGIRKQLLGVPESAAVRESLLVATLLFDRAVWLVHELEVPAEVAARELDEAPQGHLSV